MIEREYYLQLGSVRDLVCAIVWEKLGGLTGGPTTSRPTLDVIPGLPGHLGRPVGVVGGRAIGALRSAPGSAP